MNNSTYMRPPPRANAKLVKAILTIAKDRGGLVVVAAWRLMCWSQPGWWEPTSPVKSWWPRPAIKLSHWPSRAEARDQAASLAEGRTGEV